jgi:predicted TIM-barrel fold metal-dependent hydrolase
MIIDFRFTPPTPEGLPRYTAPPKHLQGYAEVFGRRVYGGENPDVRLMSAEELVAYLDRAGVDKALLKAGDNETTQGKKYPMDRLAEYIKGHEDRLIGIGGVDLHKGMRAVRELEWSVKELGFKGVNLGPYELKLRANDKKYYPVYAKCVELDIPVLLHTSINFSNELLLDFGNPMYVDEVAVDFPELKIVCVHGGWPWMTEMIAVAWRHKNVYIEISGIRPRYIAMPGTGYEPLLVYGNSILQNQVVWGSNWPQVTPDEGIEGVKGFPLKEEVKKKWLGENAARLLGIGG